MGGSVIFYTYGSTLELNGQQLTAGMLTADLLNLSPDEYMRLKKRMTQITDLAEMARQPLVADRMVEFLKRSNQLLTKIIQQ